MFSWMDSNSPGVTSELYEKYGSPSRSSPGSPPSPHGQHSPTRASQLRSDGLRLNCYLNCEGVGVSVIGGPRGHGTIVQVPVECDTMEEVLPLIQLKLKLSDRLLYAADLFLPDGALVKTFEQLVAAAQMYTPIIVGCGEPFDPTRVPLDLLEFHRQGGGRQAPHKVNSSLDETRKRDKLEKAESVREAGHGLLPNSLAVVTARSQCVETNREKAANMRQRYMESLQRRAADQESLKSSAKQNIQYHKMEKEESRLRLEEKRQIRMEELNAERERSAMDFQTSKREDEARAKALHDKVKQGKAVSASKKKAHSERYRKEARRADFGTRPGQTPDKSPPTGTY